jgi:diguanylate cyclase (GGDEF)-like protein/PAS domain S-box-containing protein
VRDHFERASVAQAVLGLDGRLVEVNQEMVALTGYPRAELEGMLLARLGHPDDRARMSNVLSGLTAGALAESRFETRLCRQDGRVVEAAVGITAVPDTSGHTSTFVVVVQDITAQREAQAELAERALRDPLTGLANRTLLLDRLERLLVRRDATASAVGVLMIDLDEFKLINDSYGHAAGDRLLRAIAIRISRSVRVGDTVARIGGDEFVVLCATLADAREAVVVAERIRDALSQPVSLDEGDVVVTPSIGIAVTPAPDALSLLRDADAAMYRAKQRGRSRVEVYDDSLRLAITTRLRVQKELRTALQRNQLRLHYQPIVSVDTGRVVGAEALLRWAHPDRGLLAPSQFLEVAEDTGLIVPIGAWVLERACSDAKAWVVSVSNPPYVAVNISERELGDPTFGTTLERCLATSGLPPRSLVVEISERALAKEPGPTESLVELLDRLGVRLAIDDFGTGYSSFLHLRRFPVQAIKIDRQFVGGLGVSEEGTAIVTSAVSLAQALGLGVVAEGVDDQSQVDLLRLLGCPLGQGYAWAKPVPMDELLRMIVTSSAHPAAPLARPAAGAAATAVPRT